MVVEQSGSLGGVSRHDYFPFGEEIGAGVGGRATLPGYSQPDGVRQRFTGKERDNETALDYFNARYYSPAQGRFTSVDPENYQAMRDRNDPQSWNAYAYVNNNPLRRIDPDGRGFWDSLKKFWHGVAYGVWDADDAAVDREVERRRQMMIRRQQENGGRLIVKNFEGEWVEIHPETMTRSQVWIWQNSADWSREQVLTPEEAANVRDYGNMAVSLGRIGRYGYEGSPSVNQATEELSEPGTHNTVGGRVPTRAEAEQLINKSGGKIDRIERAHTPETGHDFDHINYTTASGQKATVRVEGVGRQFYRDSRPKN